MSTEKVHVKLQLYGGTQDFEFEPTDTLETLKKKIFETRKVDYDSRKLTCKSNINLDSESKTLQELGIKDGELFYMHKSN